ncbi:uncharacterized protein LOC110887015 isoform X3 [Helianthus annuus]|uniref:uncharacterized protein LOC110887015 isoform X3 n=1 Tax=Helianthus annuus TaxID=4232 RepID=UPI0016531604|nr:uncharacterized protein LOC110887015 isoform X3 [Helianthus annuus]
MQELIRDTGDDRLIENVLVPWKGLGKEPVIVLIDRVFVLAHPDSDGRSLTPEEREKIFEAKLQQIEEAESATLDAISKSKLGNSAAGNSWLGSMIGTIIGNLKISIGNVHIRYEDPISNPGHPFAVGITLAKLAAFTVDEKGNETFDTSGALDKLRKSLQLERLAIYHDSNRLPWNMDKKWEDLSPKDWVEIFEDGINEPAKGHKFSKWAGDRSYLVSPINGVLKYHRLGNSERTNADTPFEEAHLILSDVSLALTEAQYYDWIRLLEVIKRYKIYIEVSHLRPVVSVTEGPKLWWNYAAQAALQQKKMCYRLSWAQIQHFCRLRRRYIQLYAGSLQESSDSDDTELRSIERDLDPKVILLWRFLAHAKVESVKSKEEAEQRMLKKNSWFSLGWRSASSDEQDAPEGSQTAVDGLSKEEWQALNNILSSQPDEDLASQSGKDMQNMTQRMVIVSIGQAALRIININETELVCGRFEQLQVSAKFKHRSIYCDLTLKFYGLSAPEGRLCQSVSSQHKANALGASFVYLPVGENLDWRLSATISPCHVTVLMESYNHFLEFMKRSNSVSPAVAFETAAALQNKLERATRRAQEQFQTVLEEQSSFALDIDLDAPKIRVPIRKSASSEYGSLFLLDFGNFTLRTEEGHPDDQGQNLYSRFCIYGRDIAALFTDGNSDIQTCDLETPGHSGQLSAYPVTGSACHSYSLVDRCGIVVIVDQIKVSHPSHPSTRVSIQVPTLGIHLSPFIFSLLMELLKILSGTIESSTKLVEDCQAEHAPWSSPDLATEVQMLVWRGIGYSVASWQSSYLVLSGLYLYLLESSTSQNYQRCFSMAGKQLYEVPSDSVGGSPSCIALCIRGMDIQKALESSSTLVVKFGNEQEKASWLRGLVQATYRASATSSVDILGKQSDTVAELSEPRSTDTKIADAIVNGTLVETKIFICGKVGTEVHNDTVETQILEVLAAGGKVYVASCEGDLTVKMNLHLLKIKDELQNSSTGPQYLAYSVLENYRSLNPTSTINPQVEEVLVGPAEDDDFADALPDFMSLADSVDAVVHEKDHGKARGNSGDVFFETEALDESDFVSLTILKRTPQSPDYDGVDTQMSICMSKFEFFLHRPTIVALVSLGIDLGNASSGSVSSKKEDEALVQKDKGEERGGVKVKGVLGHGKDRVVLSLNMSIDSVTVFFNKEDGSHLAMLVQETFVLNLKVHPGSITVEGTLGNFRLCDVSLGTDHCWGWFCDIRNQGADALIQFTFQSYNPDDDDYEGYSCSLSGKLSSVRIVFLNRFIQELSAYFVALAAPNTEEAMKFVDKVGGFEWLIQKYEMEGSAAVKLNLSLETPIIVIPQNSSGKDFLQLDLGQLSVTNKVSWHGPEDDPSAVHLDILHAQIFGINMAFGENGVLGKPMIREGREIHLFIRRSLRDIFRNVPNFALEVKIGSLHAVVSDKEYSAITSCLTMNMAEQPNLPPNFREINSDSADAIRMLTDKVHMTSQVFMSRTVNIMAVHLNYALLELCNGTQEDYSPLANITLEGMWFSCRMTSFSELDLYVTIPRFSILDVRPDTRPEMRLMLGTSTDVLKLASSKGGLVRAVTMSNVDAPHSTMLLMDLRCRSSSQLLVVRIQLPRVLVVPDFLLAVGEFFVPSLGAITGKEEGMDPKNDPISKTDTIVLSDALYNQTEDEVNLSPSRKLVVDAAGVDDYTYDGCGKTIILNEDHEQSHSSEFRPIIVIGRGKRLRFVNVKIKNAWLLTEYTYMSNDSSFSVSIEDGVEVVMQDNFHSTGERKSLDRVEKSSHSSSTPDSSDQSDSSKPSISFEAQVVSPEFTFYDSSRSSIDGSFHAEKLLRARMDLSFMFALKENDKWVRALVKDLTVEAGSGLRILDPVDISAGYTSVKDKTNISLTTSDIFVHLSLSAISLILNLQSQAVAALQFKSPDPLSPCTNYDQVWVLPKVKGHHNGITFWRPRAPKNYVSLGDCVTSRPIPPSQAVMAVSNSFGRVRRPLGFKLVGLFSDIQQTEVKDMDCDCSLWIPISPPGYLALGCVAHIGNQPPPNHIVYCIRADLATSTAYSACMFNASSNKTYHSGFSIWRLDNLVGSFHSNPSLSCPPQDICYDLNYLLLLNSSWHRLSTRESRSDVTVDQENTHQQRSNQGITSTSSGSDALRSISKASCYMSTPSFERIWWDKGSDIRRPVSVWRPIPRPGFKILGDCITEGLEPPGLGIIFKADNPDISANPVQFTKVAHVTIKGVDEAFYWYPIAPPGYASMGCIVTQVDEMPKLNSVCCPRMDLVSQADIPEMPIASYSSSKASPCWSIWKLDNQACTFLARSDLKKPSSRLAFAIGDSVKPKTRENIMADIKLKCISLTILDSLCGVMTPFFDVSITNIKLATHGGIDSMNAVVISSIAASTFNTLLDSWEPLVEPFDGLLKFETYDTNECQSKLGKRARVAATSILNVNLSAASIDTFAETIASWGRLKELEQKAVKSEEETSSHSVGEDGSIFSALDVEDFQTITVENRLGCDIYLKKYEQSSSTVNLLRYGDSASVWIPPSRYSDRLNSVDDSREGRCYIAVQITEAKDLPIVTDGNSNRFFCALRLVVDSQEASQQRLFPQSARTRCVRPLISKSNDLGSARWNELFIFEVPRKGLARLEVEVTNLAAKAGKGEVVGASTISVGQGTNPLRKVASARMLQQATDGQKNVTHLLMRRGQQKDGDLPFQGCLVASTSYFEMKAVSNLQSRVEQEKDVGKDVGFWVGLGPEGVWESFRSFLPLSVITKKMDDDFITVEVVMKDGKKHAILRGLATITNDSNVNLDINVCSISKIHETPELVATNIAVEEIFENQRHSSIFGWGTKLSGFRGKDPGRWSNRNFSYSLNDFYEPPLPAGWTWTSAWVIDKSDPVDVDGWAYGRDYETLKWPPTPQNSSKSPQDHVRRRRWIRTRKTLTDEGTPNTGSGIHVLEPGSSFVLPWRSISRDSDSCLQIRPSAQYHEGLYAWGWPAGLVPPPGGTNDSGEHSKESSVKQGKKMLDSAFKLNQLEKNDTLWCCPSSDGRQFWLSVGADASVLQAELSSPVYDWKISVNAPLKLENRLPCPAQFTIWEKLNHGNSTERQQGLLSSRAIVPIYHADVRNSLYISLSLQGGWTMEKDPVPVLDISSNNHASSFWMIHQNKRRRLRVSIERDMGASAASPNTIRFFVPYWIINDCSVPLTYQVVEIEPSENASADSLVKTKSAKSGKSGKFFSFRSLCSSPAETISNGNIQVLEAIDDTSPTPSMLSPQDYVGQGGAMLFSSRNDSYLSPRVGLAVAIQRSDNFSPGLSLLDLEKKQRVDVKAFSSDGSYYNLSALMQMTSDRTKVIHFQPHTLFYNRAGVSLCLQQCDTRSLIWIHPTDAPSHFRWQTSAKVELLKLKTDGYRWSAPFSVATEGWMRVSLRNESTGKQSYFKVEVRNGTTSTRFDVIFRPNSFSSQYRIENHSMFLPFHFRQTAGADDSWHCLHPCTSASFLWEDLGRERILEVMVDDTDTKDSAKYNIDEVRDYLPVQVGGGPTKAVRVTIVKEEKMNVVMLRDWMPDNNDDPKAAKISKNVTASTPKTDLVSSSSDCEFHLTLELIELGLSIIDHTPEEILYLSVQNLLLSHSTGLGSGISRIKLRMRGIQVDNQLPLTPMPVLFRPQRVGVEADYVLKFSVTTQTDGSLDFRAYPYIGLQGPEKSAFLISVHEPIIWRLHGMIQQIDLSRFGEAQTTAVSVDPIIEIGVLNISEFRFKFSMAMSPTQRPVGVLGFWASLMTALGNTENMPVRVNQRFLENLSTRQSVLTTNAISNITKDILSQPLQLLSGVDILGNASSAFGHMSKGVAALSMDKKFIQGRQRQENKGVEDFGDVIRDGGGALAKGLYRGVVGIIAKPLEGAKASGVEGFVSGVGKGIIGAAAQPVSGVLDLLSKTTEGANAMRMKIAAAISSEDLLLRRRLPRVISGDNLLKPYDDYRAQGQVILQLAESGSFFLQVDLFKVRGKFALSDAYEDHFSLRKDKILLVTHRRVMLLQTSNIITQKKFNPARDPCLVLWDVLLEDVGSMQLTTGKKDGPNAPPSKLKLSLKSKSSSENNDHTRVIKCYRDTQQATQVHSSIEQAMSTYAPKDSKDMHKRKVKRPYAETGDVSTAEEIFLKERPWSSQQIPAPLPPNSTFGSSSDTHQ